MENILFVSDLDGTLLTSDVTLAKEDAHLLNTLSARGARITYATARTIASVRHILADLDFAPDAPPVSLMNGVLLCDMATERYVDRATFSTETADLLFSSMKAAGVSPFVYALSFADTLCTYYREIPNAFMQSFMDERVTRYNKPFVKIENVSDIDGDIIYFCLVGTEDEVRRAERAVSGIAGVRSTAYRDNYDTGAYYIEIFDERASKRRAIEMLRAKTGVKTIVCFGDNLNDLPMFEVSDIRCAVRSAHPKLLACADFVIDNVPRFIKAVMDDPTTLKT